MYNIYICGAQYPEVTVRDIEDKTRPELISKIKVLDLNDFDNKAKAWNRSCEFDRGFYIFINGDIKVEPDWLDTINQYNSTEKIISPIVRGLDTNLWSSTNFMLKRPSIRWNMESYNREINNENNSVVTTSDILIISDMLFKKLNGFDELLEAGEITDLCIKSRLFGYSVEICDRVEVAINPDSGYDINSSARIVEKWFPKYSRLFYDLYGYGSEFNVGKHNDCNLNISSGELLYYDIPELHGLGSLHNEFNGKTVAIVSDGPSLDLFRQEVYNNCDVLVGVDYAGLRYNCDYFTTFDESILIDLKQYSRSNFILPHKLLSTSSGKFVSARSSSYDAMVLEYSDTYDGKIFKHGPFLSFGSPVLFAIHYSIYAGASKIILYGFDNKLVDGKSHMNSDKLNYGQVFPDSDSTRNLFASFEYGLKLLGDFAIENGVKLLRYNYA